MKTEKDREGRGRIHSLEQITEKEASIKRHTLSIHSYRKFTVHKKLRYTTPRTTEVYNIQTAFNAYHLVCSEVDKSRQHQEVTVGSSIFITEYHVYIHRMCAHVAQESDFCSSYKGSLN